MAETEEIAIGAESGATNQVTTVDSAQHIVWLYKHERCPLMCF